MTHIHVGMCRNVLHLLKVWFTHAVWVAFAPDSLKKWDFFMSYGADFLQAGSECWRTITIWQPVQHHSITAIQAPEAAYWNAESTSIYTAYLDIRTIWKLNCIIWSSFGCEIAAVITRKCTQTSLLNEILCALIHVYCGGHIACGFCKALSLIDQ